jgi:hypothetical protein
MIRDLWEFAPISDGFNYYKTGAVGFADLFSDGDDIDGGGYGYPDPVLTANAQEAEARARGEEPPLTPERQARDAYFYEIDHRAADPWWAFPSFEELYGYPDPRPRPPDEHEASAK